MSNSYHSPDRGVPGSPESTSPIPDEYHYRNGARATDDRALSLGMSPESHAEDFTAPRHPAPDNLFDSSPQRYLLTRAT